jgi:3-hydroxymyristoyl/3-hydroxydecanoyl-(acyl carrier protein) dehydratase
MNTRKGKIARLPLRIREQVNQRLQDGHDARQIMDWLSTLPEVQPVLDEHFEGNPINPGNLSEWRHGGFREWQHEQLALSLVDNLEDDTALGQKELAGDLTAKLARWVAIHLAASAQAMVAYEEDPKLRWTRLGELCNRLARLRRGDLSSQRLSLDHERLELEKLNTDEEREKAFWEWTKRSDIHEKLFPNKEKGLSPETLAKIEHELKLL